LNKEAGSRILKEVKPEDLPDLKIFIVFTLLSIAHSFLLLVLNSQSSCQTLYADE
jgi:hypothetical protein